MNTNFELETKSRKLGVPLIFCGYKDQLANLPKQNGGYILNLRDSKDEHGNWNTGTHWVACYIHKNNQFYWDSFGCPPPEIIAHFLNRDFKWSGREIQNVRGGQCGLYCLGFLYAMSKTAGSDTTRWHRYVNMFSNDVTKNNDIVKAYLDHHV